MELRAWTDSAIPELGDAQGAAAPVREATIIDYDGGEHVTAIVGGKRVKIDVRFVYVRRGAEKAPVAEIKPAMRRSPSIAVDSAYVRIKTSGLNAPNVITRRTRGSLTS